jgi:thiol:disulfide interchange protein DsbC
MKYRLLTIAALMAVLFINTGTMSADDICSSIDGEFIKKHLPVQNFSIVSKKPVKGMCEIIINFNDQLIPLYAGSDFVLTGNLYKEGTKLTDETINNIKAGNFKKNMESIKKAVSFSYLPQERRGKSVYMFTDPLCGFCNRAIKSVKGLADKHGAVFNFILITVHGEEGKAKAIEAVCRHFNLDEYSKPDWKKSKETSKYQCTAGKETFHRGNTLSGLLGINGVPAFYIDDGTFISGSEMTALDRALGRKIK